MKPYRPKVGGVASRALQQAMTREHRMQSERDKRKQAKRTDEGLDNIILQERIDLERKINGYDRINRSRSKLILWLEGLFILSVIGWWLYILIFIIILDV